MIDNKVAIPFYRLIAIWLGSGIVIVLAAVLYTRVVNVPTEFLAHNEVIRLIQGGVLLLAGLLALSALNVDLKAAVSGFDANIKTNLKLALKYFLIYILAAAALIGGLTLIAMLAMKIGLFTMDAFNGYHASVAAERLTQKSYLRDFVVRVPAKFILYLFATCVLIPIEEEIFTRRLLYVSLRRKMGVSVSLIISALAFGAEHAGAATGAAIVFGMYLSWIYEKHQNLPVNIMVHGSINFFVTMVMIFYAA